MNNVPLHRELRSKVLRFELFQARKFDEIIKYLVIRDGVSKDEAYTFLIGMIDEVHAEHPEITTPIIERIRQEKLSPSIKTICFMEDQMVILAKHLFKALHISEMESRKFKDVELALMPSITVFKINE